MMIYLLNSVLISEGFLYRCFLGSLVITSVEFIVGIAVNLVLRWNVWDYSSLPLNLLGQICLPYCALWFVLCIPIVFVCSELYNII